MSPSESSTAADVVLFELRRQRVSRVSPQPLYLQAARSIESIIGLYPLAAETPLPSETDMAAALGIGRPTLRQALSHLTQAGRLYSKRGVGTFPTPAVLNRPARLNSLYDDLEAQGMQPTTQVLSVGEVQATAEVSAELGVPSGAPLAHLRRVRRAAGKPVAVIENLLNLSDSPPPLPAELEGNGLYATLRSHYGIELGMASLQLSARLAEPVERQWLELPNPCAVLVGRRLAFDTTGRGIEIGTTVYAEGAKVDGIRLQP